jgi:hypothetical protein
MPKKATTLLDVACEAAKAKRDAEKVAASAAFLTIRERDGARDLARWNAELATNAVAIMTHRPEMEAAFVAGELPEWFDRLLRHCAAEAHDTAREAGEEAKRRAYHAAFIERYAKILPALLAKALAEYEALGSSAQYRKSSIIK